MLTFRVFAVREESDFCLQLRPTNYQIWYKPEADFVHLGEQTSGCHDISMRALQYQLNFYHNHFLMGRKTSPPLNSYACIAACLTAMLGYPSCDKSGSPIKIISHAVFYSLGFLRAIGTLIQSSWTMVKSILNWTNSALKAKRRVKS
ncbi:MAG TPA: hypothetical protein V6C93_21700 [Allocoleopsis sp.]